MNKRKAIFFDRDNTIIIDKIYLNDPEQVYYLPGAFTALTRLHQAGFQLLIVTNQSGVARGLVTLENLDKIHQKMRTDFAAHGVPWAGFYYAPYLPESNHPLRKPNPGMLLQGIQDHAVDIKNSWMVGDRHTDVEAGHRAGLRTIFLTGTEPPDETPYAPSAAIAESLEQVADIILRS